MEKTPPGTSIIDVPGFFSVCRSFGAPVAVLDSVSIGTGFDYRFGTQGIDGEIWAVEAETVRDGVARTAVRTVRALAARTAHQDPGVLLRDALAEFATNATGSQDRWAEISEPQSDTVRIDGRRVPGLSANCRGYRGVAATYRDLVVVAVVPELEAERLSLGMITSLERGDVQS